MTKVKLSFFLQCLSCDASAESVMYPRVTAGRGACMWGTVVVWFHQWAKLWGHFGQLLITHCAFLGAVIQWIDRLTFVVPTVLRVRALRVCVRV